VPSVLLSSVCRPFSGRNEGKSVLAELFHAQVTRAQGIFSIRQVIRAWGLDYIAENIDAPTVVLHYPTKREFIRELRTHQYDYVGISFVVATFHKARQMAAWTRQYAPQAKVILGGYGTVLPDETLFPHCDYVCREEGIAWMRRLLHEDPNRPIRIPYAPIPAPRLFSYQQRSVVPHITAGLGCPNGCDFCCTSHFFRRRYIPFIESGRALHEALRRMEEEGARRGERTSSFVIIDEDLFLDKPRAMAFLARVRKRNKALSIMAFGSVRSLSQYDPDDIAEMGIDILFTGYEARRSGYGKLKGKPFGQLYNELKARGIAVLSSMIIGFPHQSRQDMISDFEELMSLEPTFYQLLICTAFPGTPLYRGAVRQGRYLPDYKDNPDFRAFDGFRMHFHHPDMEPDEIESLQETFYRADYERLGPWVLRIARVWLRGYRNLRGSEKPLLRARAGRLARLLREYARVALYVAMVFGPNKERRVEARRLLAEIEREFGKMDLAQRLFTYGTLGLACFTLLTVRLDLFQEPGLLRVAYNLPGKKERAFSCLRLQGGSRWRFLAAFARKLLSRAKHPDQERPLPLYPVQSLDVSSGKGEEQRNLSLPAASRKAKTSV